MSVNLAQHTEKHMNYFKDKRTSTYNVMVYMEGILI